MWYQFSERDSYSVIAALRMYGDSLRASLRASAAGCPLPFPWDRDSLVREIRTCSRLIDYLYDANRVVVPSDRLTDKGV